MSGQGEGASRELAGMAESLGASEDADLCIGDLVALFRHQPAPPLSPLGEEKDVVWSEEKGGFVFCYQSPGVLNELGVAARQDPRQPTIRLPPGILATHAASHSQRLTDRFRRDKHLISRLIPGCVRSSIT